MRLDQTYVRIRERSLLEQVDLTCLLLRSWWRALLILGFIGALPWVALNAWIMWPYVTRPLEFNIPPITLILFYLGLVVCEAPLAVLFVTAYLGRRVFEKQPPLRQVIRSVLSESGRILGIIALRRLNLPILLIVIYVLSRQLQMLEVETFALLFLAFFALVPITLIPSLFAPFSSEVIVLEKPRGSLPTGESLLSQRLLRLHRYSQGAMLGRFTLSMFLAATLFCTLFAGISVLWGYTFGEVLPRFGILHFVLPIASWFTVLFLAVFRFASYLDLRIRQEGWEIELLMKAEARALQQSQTPFTSTSGEASS